MPLNDVWRTIATDVGFFYEANFDQIPASPGVYAWFYPLRLLSNTPEALQKLVGEAQALLNYDAALDGPPETQAVAPLVWWSWSLRAGRSPKRLELTAPLSRVWSQIAHDPESFSDFQRSLLKASILMPPLYVGKADNLHTRCSQHLHGGDGSNDFHRRFEQFARHLDLPIRSVRQLVFVCVRTGGPIEAGADRRAVPAHELLESIMKSVCAPPYGMR